MVKANSKTKYRKLFRENRNLRKVGSYDTVDAIVKDQKNIKVDGTGDASIAETIASEKIKTEERIIRFHNRHIPNPLHEYNNFSPVITLIALTKEEVNFPYVLKNGGDPQYGRYVIAQTAGKTSNPANVSS